MLIICPECEFDITKHIGSDWDGLCTICSSVIAQTCYRLRVLEREDGTVISGIDKIQIGISANDTINKLNQGIVVESVTDLDVLYFCLKPKPLEYIRQGWLRCHHYLTVDKGFTDEHWTLEGVIQDN